MLKKLSHMIVASFLMVGCGEPQGDFETEPLCPSCVIASCEEDGAALEAHMARLNGAQRAQIIAQIERNDEAHEASCMQAHAWLAPYVEAAYRDYGAYFFAVDQPFYRARASKAFEALETSSPHRQAAANYLRCHIDQWQHEDGFQASLENVSLAADESLPDDIFSLIAEAGNGAALAALSALPPTPQRDHVLMRRWPELPQSSMHRLLESLVYAQWSLQNSGSSQLPQYLTLDWIKLAQPEGVPDFSATLKVNHVKIQNQIVKRGQWKASDAFTFAPLTEPDRRHARVDLHPWLSTADNVRISAKGEMQIWPAHADRACLEQTESCSLQPLTQIDISFDRAYRVFVGVDTGSPRRHKVDADNKAAAEDISISLCGSASCVDLWRNGKVVKQTDALKVTQGTDFYVTAAFGNAAFPVAARLMARSGVGKSWREIGRFYGYAPLYYDVPARAEVNLGELCADVGECALQMQLRPSLTMARRDPRISRYWGGTLDFGTVRLDIANLTAEQIWGNL